MVAFNVGISDPIEANLFLRSLWATLRKEFGKCDWQYTPWREGAKQTITFGFADLGEHNLSIGVTYKQRGTINAIWFSSPTDDAVPRDSELAGRLKNAVDAASRNASTPKAFRVQTKVQCLHRTIAAYQGQSFRIVPISGRAFLLSILVPAFDEQDAKTQSMTLTQHVLNLLSIETNSAYWLAERTSDSFPAIEESSEETFVEDPNWLEERPVKEDAYLISREGKDSIELVLNRAAQFPQLRTFLKACQHFHTARKYSAQITDFLKVGELQKDPGDDCIYHAHITTSSPELQVAGELGAAHAEITGTLYVSALEVASEIDAPEPESCRTCGQLKYQISRRVVDLMTRVGGESLGRIAKDYYRQRSQFLHAGELLSQNNYVGTSIPQLDSSSDSGCVTQTTIPCPNLLDYSGFCLRKVLKEVVDEIHTNS